MCKQPSAYLHRRCRTSSERFLVNCAVAQRLTSFFCSCGLSYSLALLTMSTCCLEAISNVCQTPSFAALFFVILAQVVTVAYWRVPKNFTNDFVTGIPVDKALFPCFHNFRTPLNTVTTWSRHSLSRQCCLTEFSPTEQFYNTRGRQSALVLVLHLTAITWLP